jgi:SAM-dependent methyltransferase
VLREMCGGCRSTNLKKVLDLGEMPLAGDFLRHPDDPQVSYPLGLVRCGRCSLIQLTYVVDDEVIWEGDYHFYTGASWPAVQQQYAYARGLINRYPLLAEQLTVEIACNDGTMLQHFAKEGYPSLGVDPAPGPVNKAREAGLDVLMDSFGLRVAENIVRERGKAGLVVANNVIAHIANLDDFIGGLKHLLAPLGVAVIEFQYVADLILGNQIDHVYHEHRQFFSLTSLSWMLKRHDLMVFDVAQTSPQGGSLRVHVTHQRDAEHSVKRLLEAEKWLDNEHVLDGLQGRANRIRSRLRDLLWEMRLANRRVAGYGASAKAATLMNFCNIDSSLVQYFVDTTPLKQGRYMPGSRIPVISPSSDSRRPDVYLLGVWNYLPDVLKREKSFEGNWIVPIPVPVVL